jgi:hypothetical protein
MYMIFVSTILQISNSYSSLFNTIKWNASAILLLKVAYKYRLASDDIIFRQQHL